VVYLDLSEQLLEKENMTTTSTVRPLHLITREIREDWTKPYFGAVPYLDAMGTLNSVSDNYGCDSAKTLIVYFLSNATTWRGDTARRVKAELKALIK
jgi:hypothetical protein